MSIQVNLQIIIQGSEDRTIYQYLQKIVLLKESHLIDHLSIIIFDITMLALETGCFSEHFYILIAFMTSLQVMAKPLSVG